MLTSVQMCERAGVSYRQLDYWRRCGVFGWVDDPPGSGHPMTWSDDDCRVLQVLGSYAAVHGVSNCGDLAGLADVAVAHGVGYAVRGPDGWSWRRHVTGGAADGAPFTVVPLGA